MSWPRRRGPVPWWFTALLVILVLPTVSLVSAAAYVIDSAQWLGSTYMGWIYPAYVVLSVVCAWICYPDRRTVAWILTAMLALTDLALFTAYML